MIEMIMKDCRTEMIKKEWRATSKMTYKKKLALFLAFVFVLSGCSTTEEPAAENTTQTEQAEVTTEIEEVEPEEPELLFTTESEYHGEVNGFKSYENENSFSYQRRFDTLEDLLREATINSRPTLSAALTKVEEPLVFYITDSYRATEKANVLYVMVFHENMVTNYPLYPNNYAETHPETSLILDDFVGLSAEEAEALADETQKKLFELTREEIISENESNEDLVYQYSQMEYISPEPQTFELLLSEQYPGAQIIRKYSKITLQKKDSAYDLMNEQLEDFNDYKVTYNLLDKDEYRSLLGDDRYLIGFTTGENAVVTIYEGRGEPGDGIIFDTEHTSGINTENLNLTW